MLIHDSDGSLLIASSDRASPSSALPATAFGQKAVVSGYHDATGDPVANAELAKQRAMKVRDTLVSLSVPEDKIEMKKPEQMVGSGSDAEARRVELVLQ